MAFWRPRSMDSWNPLNKKFWTLQNLGGLTQLEKIKQELLQQVEDNFPECGKDPITTYPLTDLVVTPQGICFNRETLAKHWNYQSKQGKSAHELTCPVTNTYLTPDLFLTGTIPFTLKTILLDIDHEYKKIKLKINKMILNDKKNMALLLNEYQRKIESLVQQFKNIIQTIEDIAQIKTHNKLDMHNAEHLAFWDRSEASTTKKMLNKLLGNSKKVKDLQGNTYHIPTSIYTLMTDAKSDFQSKEGFLRHLEASIAKERGRFFAMRSDKEKQIFSKPLESIDLRLKT